MIRCALASMAGGAVYFVLGWIIYGMIIQAPGAAEEPILWAIGVGSVFLGGVLALVLGWRGTTSAGDAFKASAGFGVLLGLAIGFSLMGTMEASGLDTTTIFRDAVIGALMYGVVGTVVAKVLGGGGGGGGEGTADG